MKKHSHRRPCPHCAGMRTEIRALRQILLQQQFVKKAPKPAAVAMRKAS